MQMSPLPAPNATHFRTVRSRYRSRNLRSNSVATLNQINVVERAAADHRSLCSGIARLSFVCEAMAVRSSIEWKISV